VSGIIVSRKAWGAAPPNNAYTVRDRSVVDTCFIHYSDTHESIPAPSEAADAQVVRAIQAYHQSKGYVDIAYEAIVGGNGDIFVGRPNWAYDASTCNNNRNGYGICVLSDGPISGPQRLSVRFCVALGHLAFPNLRRQLEPHSAACPTACPGDTIRAWIPTVNW
jgi:hypothetical protein